MKNLDLIQPIFIGFILAIFLKIFELFENLLNLMLKNFDFGDATATLMSFNILLATASGIIVLFPEIVNLKNKIEYIKFFRKLSIGNIIMFIVLFIITFIQIILFVKNNPY